MRLYIVQDMLDCTKAYRIRINVLGITLVRGRPLCSIYQYQISYRSASSGQYYLHMIESDKKPLEPLVHKDW